MEERRKRTRREARRVINPLPGSLVFWRRKSGARETAYLYDVSLGGCYLNTRGLAEVNESVTVEIPTPSERVAEIEGIVVTQERKLAGFGVRFPSLSNQQQSIIEDLLVEAPELIDRRVGS